MNTADRVSADRTNPDPLFNFEFGAPYIGYKNAKVLSVILSRGTYPILNQNVIYIGRRPHFRQSTLEKFLAMRTGKNMTGGSSDA